MPDPDPAQETIYSCPKCKNEIARYFLHADYPVPLLEWGGLVVTDLRGQCKNCGGVVHFHINTAMLQKLLRRSGVEINNNPARRGEQVTK